MPLVVVNFIQLLVGALMLLILARVVVSWVAPYGGGGLIAFIYQATEPILSPIRRVLPPIGGLDLSPLVALIGLSLLVQLVLRLERTRERPSRLAYTAIPVWAIGSARLERTVHIREVTGSNPVSPTIQAHRAPGDRCPPSLPPGAADF
jgi:YggT family protein